MLTTRARDFPLLAGRPRLAGAGLLVLVVPSTLAMGLLILRGKGALAVGGFILVVSYVSILLRWQRGVYGLLIYLPFAGVVTMGLFPWHGLAVLNPVLYKDWLFVLPAYAGFLASMVLRQERSPGMERLPSALLAAFSLLVIAQMANPGVQNAMMAWIGAKVWLLYLPLYALAFPLISSPRDLVFFQRLLVVLAIVPCAVGIAEYMLAQVLGYELVMKTVYGPVALQATQEFTQFEVGGGWIVRIPSTFTSVTQYFCFALSMLVPCYAVGRADPSAGWRRLGRWMLVLVAVAAFLSGARAAFVFVPFLLALMYGLDRGFSGVLRAGLWIGGMLAGALAVSRMAALPLFQHISNLFSAYALDTAYGGLAQAVGVSPWGMGTGTNTGPARYALERPELFVAIENYYAKVVYELGAPGLLLVWALFVVFIAQGLKSRHRFKDPALRASCAALTAFLLAIALYSFKGWFVDLDPINVYFWVFAGVLAKLPALDTLPDELARAPAEAP